MDPTLRLRQICLVAPTLAPVADDLAAIMGLAICYRDPQVGKYGLENALLPVDSTLLEIVAPVQDGTAAGRFLAKTGGRGGYMAIFSCRDPDERGRHAQSIGVRVAHTIDHPPYHGVQLHPRDCRAAFIEFNHTAGSDNILGPYPPAGPDWQTAIRKDVTEALTAVELQSPEPGELARLWGDILGAPVRADSAGAAAIALPNCTLGFVEGPGDALTALTFRVRDADVVRAQACACGYAVRGDRFAIAGVDIVLA